MMVFTHILVGILLGAVFSSVYPEFAPLVVYAGGLGGLFPDLDMVFTHRRTLHYPVMFSAIAIGLGLLIGVFPHVVAALLFVGVAAAALHCLMDILGGGKEMRPWLEQDDRAVYNHVTGGWVRPRRLIYDGSLKDLSIGVVSAAAAYYVLRPAFTLVLVVLVGFAVLYVVLRRWITRQISEEFTTFSSYIQYQLSKLRELLTSG